MADNSASWDDDSTPSGAVQGPLSTTPKFISQLQVQNPSEGSRSGKATIAPPRTIDAFVETEEEVCGALFFQFLYFELYFHVMYDIVVMTVLRIVIIILYFLPSHRVWMTILRLLPHSQCLDC